MKMNHVMGCIWIGVAVIFTIGLISGISRKESRSHNQNIFSISLPGDAPLYETKKYSISEIESFDIKVSSASIHFEEAEGNSVVVELYCAPANAPDVELNRGVLQIKAHNGVTINSKNQKIVVKLPARLDSSTVKIESASGSIHINECLFDSINLKSASGSIHIGECSVDNLNLESISGSVHVDDCLANTCNIKSTSGSIRASGSFDEVNFHAVSGSIRMENDVPLNGNSEITTTSGSIHLEIPSDSNLQINYSVASGSYRNSISGERGKRGTDIIGSGSTNLKLSTTSGSININ